MKLKSKIEKETKLLEPGIYDFLVIEAVDGVSKRGNDMITVTLRVACGDGLSHTIRDHLVSTWPSKVERAALACGVEEQFNEGLLLPEHFLGKSGRLRVEIEPARDGYPQKSAVADYIVT